MNIPRTCLIGCVIGALASSAFADDDEDARRAPAGQYVVMRGVQGPAGMLALRMLLDINLGADQAGKPISLVPNLYYSATDRLQIGIVHEEIAVGRADARSLAILLNVRS